MTQFPHVHSTVHDVADAHGRIVDFTLTGATSTHACPCTRTVAGPRSRGRPGAVALRVIAILTAGLVAAVLLVVIRDIVTTVASTSVTGLIVKALLVPSNRRAR
jgi:hypothetical protein